jgi:hypothetical protein
VAALAGTGLYLAVALPRTAKAILHTAHYGDKSAVEAFQPLFGLVSTCRSVVDNLFLGVFGVGGFPWSVPLPLVPIILIGLVALAGWWWRPALRGGGPSAGLRFMPLGLALIVLPYWLVYSARADWGYEGKMTTLTWNRYHLLPQLGLALLVCGAMPARRPALAPQGRLTRPQARMVAILIGLCFLVQLPRGVASFLDLPGQQAVLQRIERVDALCREHHISARAAREALRKPGRTLMIAQALCAQGATSPEPTAPLFPQAVVARGVAAFDTSTLLEKLSLREWYSDVDGWEFLYGSPDPQPRSEEEIRRLLGAD